MSRIPYSLTHSQTLQDRSTQLLIKYTSGALVTQFCTSIIVVNTSTDTIETMCLDYSRQSVYALGVVAAL